MTAPELAYPEVIHEHPPGSGAAGVRFVVYSAIAGVAFGALGGWLWSNVADPPTGVVARNGGVYLPDELSYDQLVSVTLWYLSLGLAIGAVAGLVVAILGRNYGVATVVAVLALTVVAAWLSSWLGQHVFGPDLQAQLAAAQPGDHITAPLGVGPRNNGSTSVNGAWVAYLAWPIGGLVGSLIGMAFWRSDDAQPDFPGNVVKS